MTRILVFLLGLLTLLATLAGPVHAAHPDPASGGYLTQTSPAPDTPPPNTLALLGKSNSDPDIASDCCIAPNGGDFSRSVERLDEVTFNAALRNGPETFSGFQIYGTKGLVGNTYNRNVFLIESDKRQLVSRLLQDFEAEARAAGANKISIAGMSVINPKIINPNLARRYGYSFERVGDDAVILQKDLN